MSHAPFEVWQVYGNLPPYSTERTTHIDDLRHTICACAHSKTDTTSNTIYNVQRTIYTYWYIYIVSIYTTYCYWKIRRYHMRYWCGVCAYAPFIIRSQHSILIYIMDRSEFSAQVLTILNGSWYMPNFPQLNRFTITTKYILLALSHSRAERKEASDHENAHSKCNKLWKELLSIDSKQVFDFSISRPHHLFLCMHTCVYIVVLHGVCRIIKLSNSPHLYWVFISFFWCSNMFRCFFNSKIIMFTFTDVALSNKPP